MDTLSVHHSVYHGLNMAMELIWRPSTTLMPIYEVLGREDFLLHERKRIDVDIW